jgi:hypothetical protein
VSSIEQEEEGWCLPGRNPEASAGEENLEKRAQRTCAEKKKKKKSLRERERKKMKKNGIIFIHV